MAAEVDPRTRLVEFLREHLRLTGTHVGCDTAQCGACTIRLNGRAVKACNLLAAHAQDAEIVTIEGVAVANGDLHPMQLAFASCRRLIWLNPLLRFAGFEARAARIAAMLPHVDTFLPAHNLQSLAHLAASSARRARGVRLRADHAGNRRPPGHCGRAAGRRRGCQCQMHPLASIRTARNPYGP